MDRRLAVDEPVVRALLSKELALPKPVQHQQRPARDAKEERADERAPEDAAVSPHDEARVGLY